MITIMIIMTITMTNEIDIDDCDGDYNVNNGGILTSLVCSCGSLSVFSFCTCYRWVSCRLKKIEYNIRNCISYQNQ